MSRFFLCCCFLWLPAAAALQAQTAVDFNRDIRPLLNDRCIPCHGGVKRAGGLSLQFRELAVKEGKSGATAIVPGNPEASEIIRLCLSGDEDERMPKDAPPLAAGEIEKLKTWIAAGALWADHWSHVKPVKPPVPALNQPEEKAGDLTEIDAFIRARLWQEKLPPSAPAPPAQWLRRVYLDVTGLPPSPEETEAFDRDFSPAAYAGVVDQLLASPHFGERWAALWMDLARYSDTKGYEADRHRLMWPWRDWLVRALNADMPFTDFTVKQLAGDLLPEPSRDDITATAMHRLTSENDEGGTDDEEFRIAAVLDRVNTTWEVWMGTSFGCVQCHDHPYDPYAAKEYYTFMAFFNNTADADRNDSFPTVRTFQNEAARHRAEELDARLKTLKVELEALKPKQDDAKVPAAESVSTEAEKGQKAKIEELQAAVKSLEAERAGISSTELPVMRELTGQERRETKVFHRGNWLDPGEAVQPGVPKTLPPLSVSENEPADRLALAKWIVSDENPLTPRVAVNRVWEQLFGIGLVETAEDFGTKGEPPSHPELLDWLAAHFRDDLQWSFKKLIRAVVLSRTYQQDHRSSPALNERDPRNRLLARGPRVRLTAEMVRDQALAVSGLFSAKMEGPSVMPPQPESMLAPSPYSSETWTNATGPDRYRRAIYTFWKRTNPYPSFITFDSAERNVCTSRRLRTNTPLQALVTLNDAVYVESAQALAQRMIREGGPGLEDRITRGWRLVTQTTPDAAQVSALINLFESSLSDFKSDAENARRLAPTPEEAALVNVASVLLNTDRSLTK